MDRRDEQLSYVGFRGHCLTHCGEYIIIDFIRPGTRIVQKKKNTQRSILKVFAGHPQQVLVRINRLSTINPMFVYFKSEYKLLNY